jgi:hypothetical protein
MAQMARTDIGFQGGQVLSVRTADDAHEKLTAALADDSSVRWHSLELEDELLQVDLSQIVYVRRETGNRAVGF